MSAFTPGPWEVSPHTKRISIINPRAQHSGRRGGGGKLIAYTSTMWDSLQAPRALANASLIAAAPELYEALDELTHEVEGMFPEALLAHAYTALAKARGEQ